MQLPQVSHSGTAKFGVWSRSGKMSGIWAGRDVIDTDGGVVEADRCMVEAGRGVVETDGVW